MNTGLDQYMDIFKDAVEDSAAKLTKSFEKILIEVIILFMVIPRKINFTQMGRYGSHVEQTYRNAFGLKKSKCIDWLKLNVSLAKRFFGKQGRWAIAIDPCYISKAGKKTPHIGRFWSGCAQSVKHGLEIMGIGLIDIDAKDCMMLKAHQSLSNKELSLRNKTMVDFYIGVIKRYRKELLKLSTLIVADAYFSTSTFVNGIKKEGFSLISRFRDNACLFYVYAGPRTGKRGRPKTKDGKIDMKNLDLTRMEKISTGAPIGRLMVGRVWPQARSASTGMPCGRSSRKTSSRERAPSSPSEPQFVHQPKSRPAHSRSFPAFFSWVSIRSMR